MILGYSVRPKSDRDIDSIADDLAERASLEDALTFLRVAYETFALLASQPNMGWPCQVRHRDLKSARVFLISEPFRKYLIFYVSTPVGVEVLRVLHGAQDIERRLLAEGVY